MGAIYTFKCPKCGLSFQSSPGRDFGFEAVIDPMICENCNQLVDVLVGRRGKIGPTGDREYDKDLNVCPSCRETNLKIWPDHHPCLKCGTNMEMSDEPIMLWD